MMVLSVVCTYVTEVCVCQLSVQCVCRPICCSGTVAGYHVTLPCRSCLQSCHNGHFWMFHSGKVSALERLDKTGGYSLAPHLPLPAVLVGASFVGMPSP